MAQNEPQRVETPPGTSPNSPSLLFAYQCRSGKFIRLANRVQSKKIDSVARIESNRIETFFCPNWNALCAAGDDIEKVPCDIGSVVSTQFTTVDRLPAASTLNWTTCSCPSDHSIWRWPLAAAATLWRRRPQGQYRHWNLKPPTTGDPLHRLHLQDGRWKITLMFDGRRCCIPKFSSSTLQQTTRQWRHWWFPTTSCFGVTNHSEAASLWLVRQNWATINSDSPPSCGAPFWQWLVASPSEIGWLASKVSRYLSILCLRWRQISVDTCRRRPYSCGKPAARRCCCRSTGQTDRRTPYRYILTLTARSGRRN